MGSLINLLRSGRFRLAMKGIVDLDVVVVCAAVDCVAPIRVVGGVDPNVL